MIAMSRGVSPIERFEVRPDAAGWKVWDRVLDCVVMVDGYILDELPWFDAERFSDACNADELEPDRLTLH
jgi:hypothetical protein